MDENNLNTSEQEEEQTPADPTDEEAPTLAPRTVGECVWNLLTSGAWSVAAHIRGFSEEEIEDAVRERTRPPFGGLPGDIATGFLHAIALRLSLHTLLGFRLFCALVALRNTFLTTGNAALTQDNTTPVAQTQEEASPMPQEEEEEEEEEEWVEAAEHLQDPFVEEHGKQKER